MRCGSHPDWRVAASVWLPRNGSHATACLVQQDTSTHGESAALSNLFGLADEVVHGADANFVGAVTNVEGEQRFAGDDVCGSGFGFDFTHGCDHARSALREVLDSRDPFCGRSNAVVAKMHGRGAGVVGAADKYELQPAL